MQGLLETVVEYVVSILPPPRDSEWREAVDLTYDFLWTFDELKFATEVYLDRYLIERALFSELYDKTWIRFAEEHLPF